MSASLNPGPELDERVCHALGWEPTKGWDDPEQRYPAVSTDGNAMLRALEAMRERYFWVSCKFLRDLCQWSCVLERFGARQRATASEWGDTLPHAVALAILAALEDKAGMNTR